MNNFVFQSPTKIMFGEHESASTGTYAEDLGIKKPLLVTDSVLLDLGLIEEISESLREVRINPIIFKDVPPDSDTESVERASALARENGCDSVIAVGGGSVLDTAKVVNICLSLKNGWLDNQGLNVIQEKLNPFIALPTTAGTGSEVSFVASVKDSKEHRKLIFGSKYLAPDLAILDPLLTKSMPPKLTAATGMDAVTHAIESIACTITNSPFTHCLSINALRMLFDQLPVATKSGDNMEARSQVLIASTMAGVAFTNSGVGVIHALAHATGALFGTHHGMTNAVFLPHGMRFNKSDIEETYAKVARELGIADRNSDSKAADILIDRLENLMESLEIPRNLKSLGVSQMDNSRLETWSKLVLEDPAIMFNPKPATVEDVMEIYKGAF